MAPKNAFFAKTTCFGESVFMHKSVDMSKNCLHFASFSSSFVRKKSVKI